jgi:hypothetical protein
MKLHACDNCGQHFKADKGFILKVKGLGGALFNVFSLLVWETLELCPPCASAVKEALESRAGWNKEGVVQE